jgi:hypothetical protein
VTDDSRRLLGRPTGKLRRRPVRHLTKGNTKTGDTIFTFNLPAVLTCPGMSEGCDSCYARRGRWGFATVQAALHRNWNASQDPGFGEWMTREVRRRKANVVRIHSSGDFYDVAYVRQWAQVIYDCPATTFYCYTRSWRRRRLRAAIETHLAPLPNLRLWYSADRSTGLPQDVPAGVRVAWLQLDQDEAVPNTDLVFRIHWLRRRPAKRIGLSLVCVTENGIANARTDCGRCGLCWRR